MYVCIKDALIIARRIEKNKIKKIKNKAKNNMHAGNKRHQMQISYNSTN